MATASSRFPGILISNVEFTTTILGRGADATVFAVEWKGTQCAAKRLHDILLENDAADRLINNFERECLTWSKLRHPAVVQFLGVYEVPRTNYNSPVLVLEKMDTSLRRYLENETKEKFPLNLKTFVLRQVSQALAYLHNQDPILVHHDLSSNNVLLNRVSFVTKVTDFGMSRAVNPANLIRKSSIKGTLAFMAPEALQDPPRYDEKLDVFSFGNVIITTLTHEWPNPVHHVKMQENGTEVILSELQRREAQTKMFTQKEKELFFRVVELCLEQRPDRRPSSLFLVQEMKHIQSNLPEIDSPAVLCDRATRERDDAIRQKDEAIRQKDEAIQMQAAITDASIDQQDVVTLKQSIIQSRETLIRELEAERLRLESRLREKEAVIKQKEEKIREKNETIRQKDIAITQLENEIKTVDIMRGADSSFGNGESMRIDELTVSMRTWEGWQVIEVGDDAPAEAPLPSPPVVVPVNRDWTTLSSFQRTIQHKAGGGRYSALAVCRDGSQLAVAEGPKVHILGPDCQLMQTLGEEGVSLSDNLWGLAYDVKGDILVSDYDQNTVFRLSRQSALLQSISCCSKEKSFKHPSGMAVDMHGRIFICDSGNHRLSVHDESGRPMNSFGSSGDAACQFNCPSDVACSPDNRLYITDTYNNRICVYRCQRNASCKFERCFRTTYQPTCIAYATGNHLIVTAMQSDVVMVYTTKGALVHRFGGSGKFRAPTGVTVDASGLVYISDSLNDRIQVF